MSMTPEHQAKLMDLLDGPGPFDLGVRFERERIIKLLEETLGFDLGIGIFDLESDCQIDLEMLIALIKGENK